MIIKAKDFPTRIALDEHVQALEADGETDLTIEGTELELDELHLSDLSTVFGVKCVTTDFKTKDVVYTTKKVQRGIRTDFGINNRSKKINNFRE